MSLSETAKVVPLLTEAGLREIVPSPTLDEVWAVAAYNDAPAASNDRLLFNSVHLGQADVLLAEEIRLRQGNPTNPLHGEIGGILRNALGHDFPPDLTSTDPAARVMLAIFIRNGGSYQGDLYTARGLTRDRIGQRIAESQSWFTQLNGRIAATGVTGAEAGLTRAEARLTQEDVLQLVGLPVDRAAAALWKICVARKQTGNPVGKIDLTGELRVLQAAGVRPREVSVAKTQPATADEVILELSPSCWSTDRIMGRLEARYQSGLLYDYLLERFGGARSLLTSNLAELLHVAGITEADGLPASLRPGNGEDDFRVTVGLLAKKCGVPAALVDLAIRVNISRSKGNVSTIEANEFADLVKFAQEILQKGGNNLSRAGGFILAYGWLRELGYNSVDAMTTISRLSDEPVDNEVMVLSGLGNYFRAGIYSLVSDSTEGRVYANLYGEGRVNALKSNFIDTLPARRKFRKDNKDLHHVPFLSPQGSN